MSRFSAVKKVGVLQKEPLNTVLTPEDMADGPLVILSISEIALYGLVLLGAGAGLGYLATRNKNKGGSEIEIESPIAIEEAAPVSKPVQKIRIKSVVGAKK